MHDIRVLEQRIQEVKDSLVGLLREMGILGGWSTYRILPLEFVTILMGRRWERRILGLGWEEVLGREIIPNVW